jgi:hypothetical protein
VRQEEELGARDSALATASREAQVLSQNIEALKTEVRGGAGEGGMFLGGGPLYCAVRRLL